MPDNKSISQLTTAEQLTLSALFETSIPNGSLGYLSRKVSLDSIADYIGNDHLFSSDLQTTDKTLTGAINEAAQSGGGASIQEMTQAQYNALTPEQKADGTLRAISDAKTSIGDIDDVNISAVADGDILAYDSSSSKWVNKELEADAIAYDNTSSGLTATDVNAAIDEVNGDFDDNVCKGRIAVQLTEITSSSVINITRTATLQTYLVVVRGSNAGSLYIGLISGYNGGSSRNTIVELSKGGHIGTVSFLTPDVNNLTLSISIASSSISASLHILVVPFQSDDTFTITKA